MRAALATIFFLCLRSAAWPASAQSPTALATLVEEARHHNPDIQAARRGWQAAAQVPSQVSTLPDPQVMLQHVSARTPIPFSDYNKVEMTYISLGISQDLPYPGKLRLRGEVAEREAAVAQKHLESVERSVVEQNQDRVLSSRVHTKNARNS